MKVLILLYILIVIANIFVFRIAAKHEIFDDLTIFIASVLLIFIPIANVAMLIGALISLLDAYQLNINTNELAKKIFFVKDKK